MGAQTTDQKQVFSPQTDIYETDSAVVVVADLPGVTEESLEVTVENNKLKIHGSTDASSEDHRLTYKEYRTGDFERRFVLSNKVDGQNIEAQFKNGVVELTLPKTREAAIKKIPVKAS